MPEHTMCLICGFSGVGMHQCGGFIALSNLPPIQPTPTTGEAGFDVSELPVMLALAGLNGKLPERHAAHVQRVVGNHIEELTKDRDALRARCDLLSETVSAFENQEGMCCPEDVGFVEYIPVLQTKLAAAEAALARVRALEACEFRVPTVDGVLLHKVMSAAEVLRAATLPPQEGGL